MSKNYVYWVYDETCTDPTTQGYVGVTRNLKKRWDGHRHRFPQSKMVPLFEGNRDECFELERQLRPKPGLGWNRAVGGAQGYLHGYSGRIAWNKEMKGLPSPFKGRHWSVEDRVRIANASRRENLSPETRERKRLSKLGDKNPGHNRRWMNRDGKHRRVQRDEVHSMLTHGWNEGRLIQRDTSGKFEAQRGN